MANKTKRTCASCGASFFAAGRVKRCAYCREWLVLEKQIEIATTRALNKFNAVAIEITAEDVRMIGGDAASFAFRRYMRNHPINTARKGDAQ